MRIVIDMQGAQTESRFRGIGRYTLSLAKAIVRNRGEHEIILALSGLFPDTIESIRGEFNELLRQENIRVWYAPGPIRECEPENVWRREAAELIREAFISSLQPDVVYITSLFEGYVDDAVSSIGSFDQKVPVSVSLYDLIPLLNSEQYLKPNPTYEKFYRRKISYLQKSSQLLAISEYAQQEGTEHLDQYTGPIVNISTAVEENFYPLKISQSQLQILRDKFSLTRPFLLYTGGADERKNLPRLIRAYAQLSPELRDAHQLVFAGRMPEGNVHQLQQIAKSEGLRSDELIFTGYITDDELVKLYNLCKLYVFPSWHEGFGLPALEAMSCGAAVIGANTSSLPEVIGNEDALFDPFSEEAIALKMTEVLSNEVFRQGLIESGLNQAKQFAWDKSAKVTISVFENLVKEQNSPQDRLPATHILSNQLAKVIPADISEDNLVELAIAIGQNHSQAGQKQLFVDVSELSQRDSATGVQRVTRSILMELLNSPPVGYRVEPVYATTQSCGYYYARKYTAKILGQLCFSVIDEPLVPMMGDLFLGLDLQHHVVISQEDYFSRLKRKGISLYFLVHDLLPITFAKYFADGASGVHAQWLEVISRFDGLVCVSETTALDVEGWVDEYYPDRKEALKISYSHNGSDIEGSVPSKGLPEDYEHVLSLLKSSYSFLMVGTLEPRKGQNQVLLAFEELWSKGIGVNLVLVGKQGWMVDDLVGQIQNNPLLGNKLFWLDGISDEYLEKVYAASTCLIAASECEGFGLPLIEAAQHELPIIARDIPIFREVAGQYAYYFKGKNASGLAKGIESWINLFQKQKHPKSDEMPWLTWKQSTDRLVGIVLKTEQREPAKQLLVDVSELIQRDAGTGIQRVVRALLKEFLACSGDILRVEPVYATTDQGYRYARHFNLNTMDSDGELLVDEAIEYRPGDIFLGLDFQPQVVAAQRGFYQRLRRNGVQVQFVVYDLLCILMPQNFVEGAAEGHGRWLEVVAESDGAICISKAVEDEVDSWIKKHEVERLRPFNISWFHLGADVENSAPSRGMPDGAEAVLKIFQGNSSFLMVGTIEPRKGYAQTLAAFEQLWSNGVDVNLVIVGKQGWMVEELIEKLRHHPELGKQLFWLEGISDEYLEKVYAASTCLIAASEGEGFGLPLIEAAQHNLPIIVRDIPVFREVAGKHAFYFDGKANSELARVIQDWLKLHESNEHPNSGSMPWLTWKESAIQLGKLMNLSAV